MSGAELRAERQAVGVTQRWLAGQIDVTVGTISAWETGRRRIRPAFVPGLREALAEARRNQ